MTEDKPAGADKPKKKKPPIKRNYLYAVGRRRTATARVRLYLKKGPLIVNGQPIEQYFPGEINKTQYLLPFTLIDKVGAFSATIKVAGSGKKSQLGAIVHGLSRALSANDAKEFKPTLKRAGMLTRDSRKRERRKVGTGGKARRKKQSPKR